MSCCICCACKEKNKNLVICLLVSSIISLILDIIYFILVPYKSFNRLSNVKTFSIIRIVLVLICFIFSIFMIVNRNNAKHKQNPFLLIEKIFSIVCLVFSLITLFSYFYGNTFLIDVIEDDPNLCAQNCEIYPKSDHDGNYVDDEKYEEEEDISYQYICSEKITEKKCKVIDGEIKYLSRDIFKMSKRCNNLYLCTTKEETSMPKGRKIVLRLILVITIGFILAIYWIIMVVNWSRMVQFVFSNNPDRWVKGMLLNKNEITVTNKIPQESQNNQNSNDSPDNKNSNCPPQQPAQQVQQGQIPNQIGIEAQNQIMPDLVSSDVALQQDL